MMAAWARHLGAAVLATLAAIGTGASAAEPPADWSEEVIFIGLKGSFSLPLDRFRSNPLTGLSIGTGLSYPMSRTLQVGNTYQGAPAAVGTGSPTLDATVRYEPIPGWFAMGTFQAYAQKRRQAPWNPDFSYGFGYDSRIPFSLRLTYFNYGGNRVDPVRARGERITRFNEGTWSVGLNFPVPQALASMMLIQLDQTIDCAADVNLNRSYFDLGKNRNQNWKTAISVGCRYPIIAGIYFEPKVYLYPAGAQQQPWDPDFTYAFGWSAGYPDVFSIRYGNYSGNRWPSRKTGLGQGRFDNGSLSISWSHLF